MKKLVGIAVAAALSVGAANAAIVPPGTGTGELIEWVVDTTDSTVYARGIQTGVNSILPTASILTSTQYNATTNTPPDPTGTTLGTIAPDQNLTNFLAQQTVSGHADSFVWGVSGASGPNSTGYKAGNVVFEFSSTNSLAAGNLNVPSGTSLTASILTDVSTDVTTLNGIIGGAAGNGASAVVTAQFSPTAQVFSAYTNNAPLLTALGGDQNLYAETADGNSSAGVQLYLAGAQISMTSNGTLESVAAPVPLPAAVWLLGSGLLGLAGVGRRRKA